MTEARIDERWRLRPLLLAGLGLATGIVAHLILGNGLLQLTALRVGLLSFVTVSAIVFGFVVEREKPALSAWFAVICGAVAGLVLYWHGGTAGWGTTEGWRTVSLVLAIAIAAPLFQAGRASGFRETPYAEVHDHGWTNVVLWGASCLFVGIVFALAWLIAALFDLIGIEFLERWLQKDWFWRPLAGLAFGTGLALLREHEGIVRTIQTIVTLVLGVLAPVLAAGLALFLLALPFTGLQPLWDATKATTPILLFCAVGALILVNAVIGNRPDDESRALVVRVAAIVLGVVMLPLAAIAAVATGLRIDQYGFTPERLWGLTFVVIATAVGLAYLVSAVRGRLDWAQHVRPANLKLAFAVCGVALVLATPLLSFNAISTRDQIARLESGKVKPDQFDWAALAFDFGEPGRAALKRLAASGPAAVRTIAADTLKKERRWDVADKPDPVGERAALDRRLRVLPGPVALPDGLRDALLTWQACGNRSQKCTLLFVGGATDAVMLKDECYRELPKAQPGSIGTPILSCIAPVRLSARSGGWKVVDADDAFGLSDAQRTAIERGFASGDVTVRPVAARQVFVGGVAVGNAF